MSVVDRANSAVKTLVDSKVIEQVASLVEGVLAESLEDEQAAEKEVWAALLEIGRLLLVALLARRCWPVAVTSYQLLVFPCRMCASGWTGTIGL